MKKNIKHIEDQLSASLEELSLFPKYFHIETTNSCNARCIMCGIDFDKKEKLIMSDELFIKVCQDLHQNIEHVRKVMPYLDGEPLIDPYIFKRIKMLKEINVPIVNISTNASLLTETKINELLDSGLDEIYITIDSLEPKIFEQIRKRLSFNQVMENSHLLIKRRNERKSNLKIRMQIILQELNIHEKDSFVDYWKRYLDPSDEIVTQYSHNWGKKVNVKEWGDEESINQTSCIAPFGTLVIHSNGDIPLCCIDSETEYKMGNIGNQTISEIWNSASFKAAREAQLLNQREKFPLCVNCTLWRKDKRDIV